jgi:hypothetical protein
LPHEGIGRRIFAAFVQKAPHYRQWLVILIYRNDDFFVAEVKASGDKLSDAQKIWISNNRTRLKLPFRLVKVHKIQ